MKYEKCGFVDWWLKTPTMSIDEDTGVGEQIDSHYAYRSRKGSGRTDRQTDSCWKLLNNSLVAVGFSFDT